MKFVERSLVSDQINKDELRTLLAELEKALQLTARGDIVEFGCYVGTASLFISNTLKEQGNNRAYHVYDSFAGLPEKTAADASPVGTQFRAGALLATKQQFIKNFRTTGLPLPIIHKAWFNQLSDKDIPHQIAFAFLDGDFYESIKDSLKLIENKLVPGAIIVVDDYQSEALPGARKAVDEWLNGKPYRIRSEHSLAVIRT